MTLLEVQQNIKAMVRVKTTGGCRHKTTARIICMDGQKVQIKLMCRHPIIVKIEPSRLTLWKKGNALQRAA